MEQSSVKTGKQRVIRQPRLEEQNYPAHKLDFLALRWAVTQKCRDYLYGHQFVVMTDNNSLSYALTSAKVDWTGHRRLGCFDFSIVYRSRKDNRDVDVLSNRPQDVNNNVVKAVCNTTTTQQSEDVNIVNEVVCEEALVKTDDDKNNNTNWDKLQREDRILKKVVEWEEKGVKVSQREQQKWCKEAREFGVYLTSGKGWKSQRE